MGRLGIANRIVVVDIDLAETQDIQPFYSDCVFLFQSCDAECDSLAQEWLSHMGAE